MWMLHALGILGEADWVPACFCISQILSFAESNSCLPLPFLPCDPVPNPLPQEPRGIDDCALLSCHWQAPGHGGSEKTGFSENPIRPSWKIQFLIVMTYLRTKQALFPWDAELCLRRTPGGSPFGHLPQPVARPGA